MIILCGNCEQAIGEECGDTGKEIWDDSYCGECLPGECNGCRLKDDCPVSRSEKIRWGIL